MASEGFFRFPRLPTEPADIENAEFEPSFGERIVTAAAIAAAVLVLASIAVLMGTVGP